MPTKVAWQLSMLHEALLPSLVGTERNMNYEVEEMLNPVRNQGPLDTESMHTHMWWKCQGIIIFED